MTPAERRARIVNLRWQGRSIRSIAEEVQVSQHDVRLALLDHQAVAAKIVAPAKRYWTAADLAYYDHCIRLRDERRAEVRRLRGQTDQRHRGPWYPEDHFT